MAISQKAAGFKQPFRISKRTARLVFDGIYEGAEVVVRLDVPVSIFLQIQELIATEKQLQVFELFGDHVLDSWNIQDENGYEYSADGEGMNTIPIDLANIVLTEWVEVATQPAAPLGES